MMTRTTWERFRVVDLARLQDGGSAPPRTVLRRNSSEVPHPVSKRLCG